MMSICRKTFGQVLLKLYADMRKAPRVDQYRWQGVDVSSDPSAACYELRNISIEVDLDGTEDVQSFRDDIEPNLPWVDEHFAERVSGEPLNPPPSWVRWPWANSAEKFVEDELFNHTYPERLWPRYPRGLARPMRGIGFEYGDLNSLVDLLIRDPYTRQAYIPLFFPEDTGWGDGGRKPCTLGYQFIMRDGSIDIFYPMRSCDLVRHFRDDCYLAVRLLLWVLDECRRRSEDQLWESVFPGVYWMTITSLHVFENDRRLLDAK